MKNKGFTLAEVLIVLAVLGFIALLVLPAIISNVQKNQVGPALTKAIATLETAHAIMINEREMNNITEGCRLLEDGHIPLYTQPYISNCFEPYIMKTIGAAKENVDVTYDNYNESGVALNANSTYSKYTTKSGITYIFPQGGLFGSITDEKGMIPFFVDINGINKKPNILGKDLFRLVIAVNKSGGDVIPLGGKYFREFFDSPVYYWENNCSSNTPINRITGDTCGGSVIDNGGKVIYPWK